MILQEKFSKKTLIKLVNDNLICVDWPAAKNIKAFSTTRLAGFSKGNYQSFNLANHVGDDVVAINKNREKLKQFLNLKTEPMWLNQVHGEHCIPWKKTETPLKADASFSTQKKQVCTVMTADCLPILFCDQNASWVAACHAGWRGLLGSVIENTLATYQQNGRTKKENNAQNIIAWIGPAISQKHFEVGEDVFASFVKKNKNNQRFFIAGKPKHYYFDYIGLAKNLLHNLGIKTFGGNWCSYEQSEYFYSYRRNNQTGRMASLIWIE